MGSGLEGHRNLSKAFLVAAGIQLLLLVATFGFSVVGKNQTSRIVAFDMAASRLHTDFENVSDGLQRFYRELANQSPSQPYIEALQTDLSQKVEQLEQSLAEMVADEEGGIGPFDSMDDESRELLTIIVPRIDTFIERASSFASIDFENLKERFARPSVVDLVSSRTGMVGRSLEELVYKTRDRQQRNIEYVHAGNVSAILLLLLSLLASWRLIIAPALSEQRQAIDRELQFSESLGRKNAELQLAEGRARLLYEDAMRGVRARTEFLAVVSHELRTPLNAVIGFSEIMKDELFGKHEIESYKGFSGDIHQSGKHLLSIVEDILEFSRYESGRYDLEESDVPLTDILADARMLLKDQAAKRDVTLYFNDNLPKDTAIRVDRRLFYQALLNLIDNAIKFSSPESAVTITGNADDKGGAVVAISDSGIGIDPDVAETLFEPFEQVEGAFNRQAGGLGLGLAIAKKVMDSHGGEISLESTPGQGSCFTLRLPAERLVRPASDAAPEAKRITQESVTA